MAFVCVCVCVCVCLEILNKVLLSIRFVWNSRHTQPIGLQQALLFTADFLENEVFCSWLFTLCDNAFWLLRL